MRWWGEVSNLLSSIAEHAGGLFPVPGVCRKRLFVIPTLHELLQHLNIWDFSLVIRHQHASWAVFEVVG